MIEGNRMLRLVVVALVLGVSFTVAAEPATTAPLTKRGAYTFDGSVRCPLAGIGARGPNACNRVALDDDHSRVVIGAIGSFEGAFRRIVLTNTEVYAKKTVIADVLSLAMGVTKTGQRLPIGVHLKIEKKGTKFEAHVHAHSIVHDDIVSAQVEPLEVVLSDGQKETTVLTAETARKAVLDPGAMAKLARIFVEVRDNLDGGAAKSPGVLSDISIGLGLGRLSKMVLRVQLESRSGVPRTAGAARLVEMFKSGAWDVRLTSLSSLLPKDVLVRELFLFGLDDLSVLEGIKKDGLAPGAPIVFGMNAGEGSVQVGAASQKIPGAVDKARAFLEFSFLGAILEHQAELVVVP
jgi:hypothetical protein